MEPLPLGAAPSRSSSWVSGASVGRYTLLSPIAKGGMAEIWLARQSGMKGFQKVVVVKRMINALEDDLEHVEMFLTEARLVAQLNHQNIVQIYELGELEGSYYISMEYLDGENLASIRRASQEQRLPIPIPTAVRLVAWAAEGLHYAHSRVGLDGRALNIVHRDVSPQNLIVTFDGGLKVVDFGIAKAATHATTSGKLKGKLAYMSPEQARVEPLDARSDVFALGVVLFELLTGTRLLGRLTDFEMLARMAANDPLPRARERRADLPVELDAIVAQAMARAAADRFQSARELQIALEEWLRAGSQSASSAQVADYMKQLFAARIEERRALIQAAMADDFSIVTQTTIANLAQKLQPDSGSLRSNPPPVAPPQRRLALGLGLAGALGVALVGWAALRPAAPPASTVTPPASQAEKKRAPPILMISSDPAGAAVSVDGRPRGAAPVVIEDLTFGDHLVEGTLTGWRPAKRTVTLEHPGERTQVLLALTAEEADAGARPGAAIVRAMGKLTLKTEPWTTVYLGKQKLGDTPLVGVALPSGRHVLQVVNPEDNISSSIEVDIKPGETTVKKLRL